MKHVALLLLAIACLQSTHAQTAGYLKKDNGSSGTLNCYSLYEDGTGNTGIGTTSPSASLQINHNVSGTGNDFFSVTQTVAPSYTTYTKFVIKEDGKTGIGLSAPEAMLHLQTHNWNTGGFGEAMIQFNDPDGNLLGGFFNEGDGSGALGGSFLIMSQTSTIPAFGVVNGTTESLPFAVMADGSVGMGIDVSGSSGYTPAAQLNIAKNNIYDYLVKMQSYDQSEDYLTVHNDGYVGIGAANAGNATLQVVTPGSGATAAGVIITGTPPGNRFLFIGNGTNPASATPYFSVKNTGVGIGLDDLSLGSNLAIKGSSATYLDLYETSSTVTNNAQLRFVGSNGTSIRHKITEDAGGNLLIDAGVASGGATDAVIIDGNLQVGTAKPNSSTYINAASGEHNLSVNGWVVAKKVMVETGSWADKVFAANYNLRTLSQVEAYINQNNHLPEIPSECEVLDKGVDVAEMNKLLLQKVEELTLYLIAQQKQIDALTQK
jgi:hypothetical protein